MTTSITNIIKQSTKLNIVAIVIAIISLPKNIIIAMILLPEEFGLISFLGLWSMYAGLIKPGILAAGRREIPYLLGKGEKNEALRIQNISISGNLLYSIFPFMVIFCASLFFSNQLIKIGLVITAIAFVLANFVGCWTGINFIRQKFGLVAKGNLIHSIFTIGAVVALVYWLKIYGVLLAPIIGTVATGVYYWKKGKINYHFQFDWQEIIRLLKAGIVLSLLGLIFWGFRLTDRTIIAASLSLKQLGLYAYAMVFITVGWNFFANLGRVLQPIVWEQSGQAQNNIDAFSGTEKVAIYLALITAIAIPLSQLGFYLLVNLITTKYINSTSIFYVLSYNLYLGSIAAVPSIILTSKVINRQIITTVIYSIGLGLNVALDLLVIYLGYGILGVAWITVGTQGIVTFMLYYLARKYIFTQIKEFTLFMTSIIFPFFASILFLFFHSFVSSIIPNLWFFSAISLATQGIVWGIVIRVGYRRYFPKEKVASIVKEFTNFLMGKLKKGRAN